MKILFLTRRFWPEVGGVEKHTLEVAKGLVKLGHKVTVVCEEFRSTPSPRRSPFGSPSEVFPCNSSTSGEYFAHPRGVFTAYKIPIGKSERLKKFQIWWWLWKNRKLVEEADIVHAHDVGFWYWPARLLYPQKSFFITFHGWEGKFPVPLKNKIVRKISEKLARGNICVGEYLEKWYGTKADDVTYGGISFFPPPRGSPSATPEVSLPIVFIGRLEQDTGLPIYLQALKILDAQYHIPHTTYHILFLGDGNLRKEAEKQGKVFGFVEDVRPYILKSRFVFTSGYLGILEAMSCKKLVFSVYDNPLKGDYLRLAPFSKWVIIAETATALSERLSYYTEHPEEEKKLVEAGYTWVKKQSWEKAAEMYLGLWGHIPPRRSPR